MRFLLLNQTFHPDVAATGQYLAEVAVALAERGHVVTVVTSRRAYDEPGRVFSARERWCGVEIVRVGGTGLGKGGRWRRALDFASFFAFCTWRLLRLPRHDVFVALTSPPLIAFLAAWVAKARRSRFIYWVMDLNPDEAIAAGWLRPNSLTAKVLKRMSRFSLTHAEKVIVLDKFMKERIGASVNGVFPPALPASLPHRRTGPLCPPSSVLRPLVTIPPWSHDGEVRFDATGRERFRKAHGLQEKFVVMYSGNHSPCHPLDTLLAAAARLAGDPSIAFCFIGGGSEWRRLGETVRRWDGATVPHPGAPAYRSTDALAYRRTNPPILMLPYQPLAELSASLSAADLHVVIMGERFVGLVHPCKIYNILAVGSPVLYIGPEPSHVTEMFAASVGHCDRVGQGAIAVAGHGEVEKLVEHILRIKEGRCRFNYDTLRQRFAKGTLLPRLLAVLEGERADQSL